MNVTEASRVNGPSRPISITTVIINFPPVVKAGVMPVLNPTVPSAEAVSNITSSILNPFARSVTLSASVAANKTTVNSTVIVIALRTITSRTERPNIYTSSRFLSVAMTAIITTARVTVFIPPAVPPGEPPMNISRIKMNLLAAVSAAISTVLNPAVRAVTD